MFFLCIVSLLVHICVVVATEQGAAYQYFFENNLQASKVDMSVSKAPCLVSVLSGNQRMYSCDVLEMSYKSKNIQNLQVF